MPAVTEHPPTHPVDDDDLATELTQRPPDALEITALDSRCADRRKKPPPPRRLTVRVVNGIDSDDDTDTPMAPARDRAHLVEPRSHDRRREHHERSGPCRIHFS